MLLPFIVLVNKLAAAPFLVFWKYFLELDSLMSKVPTI